MEAHLYLNRGKKRILLVRYFGKLHFVELDHRMNYKVRPWFLEQPRTEAEMDEKGLIRESIPLEDIRGVAAGGTGRGMVVQFYLKTGKKRYELTRDCELEAMSALFDGLESFEPPKKDSKWSDPRLARQDPKTRGLLWALGALLNIAVCAAGFMIWVSGFRISWICWGSLLCLAASMALYGVFPDYFTIFPEKRKYGQKKGVRGLLAPLICPLSMLLGAISCYEIFAWWKAWMIGAAAVALLAVMLYLFAPVFRAGDKMFAVVLVGLLLSGGPVLALNALLDTAPAQIVHTEVLDKECHHSTKSGDSYSVTVRLDEKEREIPVGGAFYNRTEIGQVITVEVHAGAFQIGFAVIGE